MLRRSNTKGVKMKCPPLDLLGGEKGESLSSGRSSGAAKVINKAAAHISNFTE